MCGTTIAAVVGVVATAIAQQPGRVDKAVREGWSPYAIGLWGDLPYSEEQATTGIPNLIADMQRWMAWMNDLDKKGHLKDRGQPLERTGKVVRGQQKTVTDGPFTEAKDLVGGFTLVEARDIDQAVELSRGCPVLEGGGSVEVRPVMEMDM